MSAHYSTEPTPTASATLNTTFGPLHIALFAKQTPLTCKNFLQHCQDGYYTGTIFHRVVPDFVIQGGDPTGTGSGGTSIYEYPEFEYDPQGRDPNERIILRDELHSRLRFNRRGLLGMAKSEDGSYGSQFFITLANTERELNGQCTMFGRIEGDSIFNVLKIADAERVEGSERPVYPVKITSCAVGELGPLEGKLLKRQLTAPRTMENDEDKQALKKRKKKPNPKAAKALLSFGADDGDEDMPDLPTKPIYGSDAQQDTGKTSNMTKTKTKKDSESRKRLRSRSPSTHHHKEPSYLPKSPNPIDQLPLGDPEKPSRSPSPSPHQHVEHQPKQTYLSRTNAEIEAMKNSMRRTTTIPDQTEGGKKKSALDEMIPETAIRGRKRPTASSTGTGTTTGTDETLKLFNAFKNKLENADSQNQKSHHHNQNHNHHNGRTTTNQPKTNKTKQNNNLNIEQESQEEEQEQEAQLCDLHFIANCQSCKEWDNNNNENEHENDQNSTDDNEDNNWLTHKLQFGKDTLGKDISWKRDHPDDIDSLMVIDPREKEREILGRGRSGKDREKGTIDDNKRGFERDRERERKLDKIGHLEWR